ncbi:UNVERIFIED_CONTAM: hypothetical protein PYX00_011314 [Menopon gallinae]|uniref:Small ribosomal subunit protein uS10 domain-containing protein n=1 Tax=Menopon gallinae TaxID=328185 RepID=A0AAW2H7D8_9NEOP
MEDVKKNDAAAIDMMGDKRCVVDVDLGGVDADIAKKKYDLEVETDEKKYSVDINLEGTNLEEIEKVCKDFYVYAKALVPEMRTVRRLQTKKGKITTRRSPCGEGTNTWSRYRISVHRRSFSAYLYPSVLEKFASFLKGSNTAATTCSTKDTRTGCGRQAAWQEALLWLCIPTHPFCTTRAFLSWRTPRDTSWSDGNDCYREARVQDVYGEFERTQGISTTDIVGRSNMERMTNYFREYHEELARKFSSSIGEKSAENVVFIDNIFDLFHAGHVSLLKHASTWKSCDGGSLLGRRRKNDTRRVSHTEFYGEKLVLQIRRRGVQVPALITPDFLRSVSTKHLLQGKHKHPGVYKLVASHVTITRNDHEFSYLTEKLIVQHIFYNYERYQERNKKKLLISRAWKAHD